MATAAKTSTRKAPAAEQEVVVMEVNEGEIEAYIVGRSPLILNRMPEKAWHELLFPRGRKTAADKAANLKHDPFDEYRSSPYKMPNANDPTLIAQLGSAFKKALSNAALYMPGTKKSEIGCLTYVPDELVPIWGVPKIFSSIVRSADMNHTPDVRTRLIVPRWAARVRIRYIKPLLREEPVMRLLAAAGLYMGVGDYRPQKGAGSYGQFQLVDPDSDIWNEIAENGGRDAQIEALRNPVAYNDETKELLSWFVNEVKERGHKLREVTEESIIKHVPKRIPPTKKDSAEHDAETAAPDAETIAAAAELRTRRASITRNAAEHVKEKQSVRARLKAEREEKAEKAAKTFVAVGEAVVAAVTTPVKRGRKANGAAKLPNLGF